MAEKGKVYFVGAGPGAIDLITVRGLSLIKEADTIIYAGSLVNPELLSFKKEGAFVYDSSKMTLDEIVESMVSSAKNHPPSHRRPFALWRDRRADERT